MNYSKSISYIKYSLFIIFSIFVFSNCQKSSTGKNKSKIEASDSLRLIANNSSLINNKTEVKKVISGEEIYKTNCAVCHKINGLGSENYPPLAGSDFLLNRVETIKAVKYGLVGGIVVNNKIYNTKMVAIPLSKEEIQEVINYIYKSWGNNIPPINIQEIDTIIAQRNLNK